MKRVISAALLLVFAGRANANFDCENTPQYWASYNDSDKHWTAPLKSTSCSDPLTQLSSAVESPASDNNCGPLKGYLAFSLDKYVVQDQGDNDGVKIEIDTVEPSSQSFAVGDGGSPVKVANFTKTWDATCPPPTSEDAPTDKSDKWGPLKKKAGWCAEGKTGEIVQGGKTKYDMVVCAIRELAYRRDQVFAYRSAIFELVEGKRGNEHTKTNGALYNVAVLDDYYAKIKANVREFWRLSHAKGPETPEPTLELQRLSFGTFPQQDGNFYKDKLYAWAQGVNQDWKAVHDLLKPPPAEIQKREQEARARLKKSALLPPQPSFDQR